MEVELTSLAHNSYCPNCGKTLSKPPEPVVDARKVVMEQLRERIRPEVVDQPLKRRRRLLSSNAEDEVAEPMPAVPEIRAYEPKVMDDDVHERMWFDPEVQIRIKWLRWGGGILAGLLLITIVADRMKWWTGLSQYFASVTDKALKTTENTQSVIEANKNVTSNIPKSKPVTNPVTNAKVMPVRINRDGLQLPLRDSAPNTSQEAALKAVGAFLNASSLQERIKFVRQQDIWGPRMREYYARNKDGIILFDRVESTEGGANDEAHFTFSVVLQDGQRRNIVVGKAGNDNYLVDWPSFVLYSEMDWDKFRSLRPTEMVTFRVLAMPGDYFKNAFSDPKNLLCLKLSNPLNSAKPPLYAYADRNSSAGRSMAFLMQTFAGKAIPLILRLKYPSPADTENQVLISEFVGEGWVARIW